jgi:Golgi SNAP receptor complex protein 2
VNLYLLLTISQHHIFPYQRTEAQRTELFSTSTGTPLTPGAGRRRFATSSTSETAPESPFRANGSGAHAYLGASREAHALHEHDFIHGTEARLDEFLAQGREVLDNLVDQRAMLKGTQRRLRDAASTLGLSRDVVSWIERRRCVVFFCYVTTSFDACTLAVRRTCTSFGLVPCSRSSASI